MNPSEAATLKPGDRVRMTPGIQYLVPAEPFGGTVVLTFSDWIRVRQDGLQEAKDFHCSWWEREP